MLSIIISKTKSISLEGKKDCKPVRHKSYIVTLLIIAEHQTEMIEHFYESLIMWLLYECFLFFILTKNNLEALKLFVSSESISNRRVSRPPFIIDSMDFESLSLNHILTQLLRFHVLYCSNCFFLKMFIRMFF